MPTQKIFTASQLFIALIIVFAITAGTIAILCMDVRDEQSTVQPDEKIDPALIQYRQTGEILMDLKQPRALAVGSNGRIFVGGDKAIDILDSNGAKISEINLQFEPQCLAIGGSEHKYPGRIYIGMSDHVEVLDADG